MLPRHRGTNNSVLESTVLLCIRLALAEWRGLPLSKWIVGLSLRIATSITNEAVVCRPGLLVSLTCCYNFEASGCFSKQSFQDCHSGTRFASRIGTSRSNDAETDIRGGTKSNLVPEGTLRRSYEKYTNPNSRPPGDFC